MGMTETAIKLPFVTGRREGRRDVRPRHRLDATGVEGGDVKERIIAVLTRREEPMAESDLPGLLGLGWDDDEDACHEVFAAVGELVREGIVGRSYEWDEIPRGSDQIGRVYYVWLRTPETAERDRRLLQLDSWWAATTGGLFGHDAELL
jgi:hypothetical protein